jgi:hypothetical protein
LAAAVVAVDRATVHLILIMARAVDQAAAEGKKNKLTVEILQIHQLAGPLRIVVVTELPEVGGRFLTLEMLSAVVEAGRYQQGVIILVVPQEAAGMV